MRLVEELPPRGARVEMIPLIDTMFLLLAFFVVAILSMEFLQGIPVELATATTSTGAEAGEISVTLKEDGSVLLNGQPVERAGLVAQVRELVSRPQAGPVLVAAAAGVRFEEAVALFDGLREARVEKVFLQTQSSSP